MAKLTKKELAKLSRQMGISTVQHNRPCSTAPPTNSEGQKAKKLSANIAGSFCF